MPDVFQTQDKLTPGARGNKFIEKIPGYRSEEERVTRTNTTLNVSAHDVPNIKYNVDDRLPVLFRYGWGVGFNQIIAPKGRIAAIDPYMDLIDFEAKLPYNTVTMANGGVPVKIRTTNDKYGRDGKGVAGTADIISATVKTNDVLPNTNIEWVPLAGFAKTYAADCYRPFVDNTVEVDEGNKATFVSSASQLATGDGTNQYEIDVDVTSGLSTGRVRNKTTKEVVTNVRPGNKPMGIFQRNEYTRGVDAFNGMMAGPILTDSMVELPWFAYKDKAEQNYWGSAYGTLLPGDLVKSDENGRFVKSPLSSETALSTMDVAELEAERQQVIGEIYAVNQNLVPEGAARWATWALEDRLNYEGFNPSEWPSTNRKNEDAVDHVSPTHQSTGEYPGYPYEKAYSDHDLNMLASSKADTFNPRMNQEYQYSELGIPGLTDGYNAVVNHMPEETAGYINYRGDNATVEYTPIYLRLLCTDVEAETVQISINNNAYTQITEGALVDINASDQAVRIRFFDAIQGIVVLEIADASKADTALKALGDKRASVKFKYDKRGLAGVPTWMDWDGCIGSVKILLNK